MAAEGGVPYSDTAMLRVGRVCEIVRYPVKSMAGTPLESSRLGWHGLHGDRRLAFRRVGEDGGFPWLSASRLPELILYNPIGLDESSGEPLPTHVRTPRGSRLELASPAELTAEIGGRLGSGVELMRLKHGIFDEATLSVIALPTIAGIAREAGFGLDRRRFRANIVVETEGSQPFLEDAWVGGTLVFGGGDARPALSVTMRDGRCMMVNLDPVQATQNPAVLKEIVRNRDQNTGLYATPEAIGTVQVGDTVRLLHP